MLPLKKRKTITMTEEEKLKDISGGWIATFKKTKLLIGTKLLIVRVVTIITLLFIPSALFLAFPPTLKIEIEGGAVAFLIVSLLFSGKLAPKYRSYKELVSGLEKERVLFLSKRPPYQNSDQSAYSLFMIKNKKIVSNSYSVIGDIPHNFTVGL